MTATVDDSMVGSGGAAVAMTEARFAPADARTDMELADLIRSGRGNMDRAERAPRKKRDRRVNTIPHGPPSPFFSLQALIAKVHRESDETSPIALADQVLAAIPPECVRLALQQALRGRCQAFLDAREGEPYVEEQITVQESKAFADWTRGDLTRAERSQRGLAAKHRKRGEFYRNVQSVLRHRKAGKVRDLPPEVLEKIGGEGT